jgi:hypothetical protein
MGEVERSRYFYNKIKSEMEGKQRNIELQLQITQDKANFDRIIDANAQFKRFVEPVETEFQRCIRVGQPRSREELLSIAIGNEIRENGPRARKAAQQKAASNIQNRTTTPSQTRSNVGTPNKRPGLSAEDVLKKRLETGAYRQ